MTWSKAIYPPLHDLLFVHQISGGQIKSLVGELELKKVVGQDPQAATLYLVYFFSFSGDFVMPT